MIRKLILSLVHRLGYDIVKRVYTYCDFERRHFEIVEKVSPYTLTSPERIHALVESVRYLLRNNVQGDFAECGVYRGGSMMAVALALKAEGVEDRDLWLFDTFEGQPKPGEKDIDVWGNRALDQFPAVRTSEASSTWVNASLEDVKQAMSLTGYPMNRIHLVKGLVEETIPSQSPDRIALLRLDTDWYQSTIHELAHLYPRLSPKGILILDDYGYFKGVKEAADEYFQRLNVTPFLHRIDSSGRLMVKDG